MTEPGQLTDADTALDTFELLAEYDDKNLRLDKFVSDRVPELSRTYLQVLIDQGLITVDDQVRRPAFKMTPGQRVHVTLPEIQEIEIKPEPIPLDILFEDADVLVINKAAGLVVHPAPGHPSGTLVNAVLHHAPGIAINGTHRPGIVHRLDKDTSGVMVVAKTDRAMKSLVEQWQTRQVEKEYLAVVAGTIEEQEATVEAPIGRDPAHRQKMAALRSGKAAVSHFSVLERLRDTTVVRVVIETGRTHQIRVHLAFMSKPIVGDIVYGNQKARNIAGRIGMKRQFLHASHLGFTLPDGAEMKFTAPLPPDLESALSMLRNEETAS
ncbi:MAG: RluA family pseudouridine synthase [Thermomicrobiales bacterium]